MKICRSFVILALVVLAWGAGALWGDFGLQQWTSDLLDQLRDRGSDQGEELEVEEILIETGAILLPPEVDHAFLDDVLGKATDKFWKPEGIMSKDVTYGAIAGLVKGLNDSHSVFFPPKEADEFLIAVDGELSGIGAKIGSNGDSQVIVIAPLPDSPAERAGIRPKDRILAIDGKLTDGFTVDEAVELIRGPKGTDVKILILHPEGESPIEIVVTRDEIHLDSLMAEVRDDGVLDIRIIQFDEDTPRELAKRIDQMTASGEDIMAVMLDLRSNIGGFFQGAVSVAGEFLEPGTPVVIEKWKDVENKRVARGLGRLKGLPMVVLVDGGTASAAEILAGALRQFAGATLIGTKTFGKGTVQEIVNFPDGSVLKITVAEWLLPDGSPVNETGLLPDVVVEFEQEDIINGIDRQKDKAEEVLQEKLIK